MQEENNIICPVCKTKASNNNKFCPNCGTKLMDSTKASETNGQRVQETTQLPKTHNVVNFKAIIEICSSIIWFIIIVSSGMLFISTGFTVVGIVLLVADVILFLLGLVSIVNKEYNIHCPYCNKEISINLKTEALNCPVCNERIIIDNYIPKKK